MFRKLLFLTLLSGILAGLACILYAKVYNASLGVDFSKVAKPADMIAFCVFGTTLAAIGYYLMTKWLKNKGEIIFNFLFVTLTFATIAGVFGATLPLDIRSPELFPGFAIPMHFFPVLAWLTLKPLFGNI